MSRHAQETGFTSSGSINMGSQKITNLADGTSSGDAVNKGQLDVMVPIGGVIMFAGSTGYDTSVWQLCDGSAISRTTFATLFARLGTAHGAGDGSTTFNVPDLRGQFVVGVGQGSGLTNRALGANGGEESVTLSATQMPSHTHSGTTDSGGVAHTHSVSGTSGSGGGHSHSGTTASGGASHTHGVSGTTGGQSANHSHYLSLNSSEVNQGGYRINWLSDADDGGSGLMMGRSTDGVAYGNHSHTTSGYTGGANNGSGAYQDHTHSLSTTSDPTTASHTHTFTTSTATDHTHTFSATSGAASATSHTHTFTTGSAGGDSAHNNMPPFYALTYLIRKA